MPSKRQDQCLVCGDRSIGINFGVPTCMPCKAFFRRNAIRLGVQEFVCQNNGHCLVTYKYRRSCNCCRLAKCFRVGMKKSLILSDEERESRNKLVEANRLKRGKATKQLREDWVRFLVSLEDDISSGVEQVIEMNEVFTTGSKKGGDISHTTLR